MLNAKDLTNGERLLIDRRRSGETKAAAAKWYAVSLYRYTQWEADLGDGLKDVPSPSLGRLAFYEESFVLRRRLGLTLKQFGARIGTSAHWVTRMESGTAPDDRLRDFWHGGLGKALRRELGVKVGA